MRLIFIILFSSCSVLCFSQNTFLHLNKKDDFKIKEVLVNYPDFEEGRQKTETLILFEFVFEQNTQFFLSSQCKKPKAPNLYAEPLNEDGIKNLKYIKFKNKYYEVHLDLNTYFSNSISIGKDFLVYYDKESYDLKRTEEGFLYKFYCGQQERQKKRIKAYCSVKKHDSKSLEISFFSRDCSTISSDEISRTYTVNSKEGILEIRGSSLSPSFSLLTKKILRN